MKLYGKNPVFERIRCAPETIKKLYLQKRTDLSRVVCAAKDAGLDFESVTRERLERESKGTHTQGVVAVIDEYSYFSFAQLLIDAVKKKCVPVFLDGITDPQNLGSIIRTLACLGGFSLVLSEHGAARVNETVLRVASGGENYVKVVQVANIATAIRKAKTKGIRVVGADADAKCLVSDMKMNKPFAVVIGAEGKGMRPGVKRCLDEVLKLPMKGADLSYNAAVAAALFCYEVKKGIEK